MHNYHIMHKVFLACTIIGSIPSVLGRLLCPSQQKDADSAIFVFLVLVSIFDLNFCT